jgi:Cu(I)/Ag(I) efflux system membrane fusion protein
VASAAFRKQIAGLVRAYFRVQAALAADQPAQGEAAAAALRRQTRAVQAEGPSAAAWKKEAAALTKAADAIAATQEIRKQREHFLPLSAAVEALVRRYGPLPGIVVRRAHCPMAFNNAGASWLQAQEEIANPYFGAAMLRCGEITETLSPPSGKGKGGP